MPEAIDPKFLLVWWGLESLLGLFPTVQNVCLNKAFNILATSCSSDPLNMMMSLQGTKVIFSRMSRNSITSGLYFDRE